MTTFSPGSYRKGDDVRVADTATDAVNLAHRGYQLDEDADAAEGAQEGVAGLEDSGPSFPEPVSPLDGVAAGEASDEASDDLPSPSDSDSYWTQP